MAVIDDRYCRAMAGEQLVAIVTGAGRRAGIGRAIARRLAADGFAVVVHERSSSSLTDAEVADGWRGAVSVVEEITAAGGVASPVAGDVLDRATAQSMIDAAGALGELSVLVNNHGNAGEANAHAVHTAPDDIFDSAIAGNLTSLHRIASVVVPALIESSAPSKAIINTSSVAGHRALARYGGYCAAKAAVERMTEQQAIELARYGIRVNCVAPGVVPTDMIDGTFGRAASATGKSFDEVAEMVRRSIPLRRFAEPDDIANAVGFLVGPLSTYITGQILSVDGGTALV